jgi:hypothetical protein
MNKFNPRLDRVDIYNNLPHGSLTKISKECGCSIVNVKAVLEGYRTDHFGIIKTAELMAAINIWKTRFCKYKSQL